jgi:hypothetical protein
MSQACTAVRRRLPTEARVRVRARRRTPWRIIAIMQTDSRSLRFRPGEPTPVRFCSQPSRTARKTIALSSLSPHGRPRLSVGVHKQPRILLVDLLISCDMLPVSNCRCSGATTSRLGKGASYLGIVAYLITQGHMVQRNAEPVQQARDELRRAVRFQCCRPNYQARSAKQVGIDNWRE